MTAADSPPPTPAVVCADRAESRAYLDEIRGRVMDHWTVDARSVGGEVRLVFTLDERGALLSSGVRSSSSPEAAREVQAALEAGAPYPPMPPDARCLANIPLVATFSSPGGPKTLALARWIGLGTLAVTALLGLALMWRRTAIAEEVDLSPLPDSADDGGALSLLHEHRFFYSPLRQSVELIGVLHAVPVVIHLPAVLAFYVVLDIALVIQFFYSRRVPLVRVSAAAIELSASPYSRSQTMATSELSSRAATKSSLILQSASGERMAIPIGSLSAKERERLIAVVRRIPLTPSQVPAVSARDLQQRARVRALAVFGGAMVLSAIAMELAFRYLLGRS